MKSLFVSIPLIVLTLLAESTAAAAAVTTALQAPAQPGFAPVIVRVDGDLRAPAGDPRPGTFTMVLSLYEQRDDATPLWLEVQLVTVSQTGRYTVFAGVTVESGIPKELFLSGTGRWLGVAVQGEMEQPRIMLLSMPYAAKAADAETIAGKSVTDLVLTADLNEAVKSALESEGAVMTAPDSPSTTNAIPKFIDAGGVTLAVSNIVDVNGNIGVATSAPAALFSVGAASPFQVDSFGRTTVSRLGVGATPVDHTIYLKNPAPGLTFLNTSLPANTTFYQILDNWAGILEFNNARDDGANVQTLCQMDFYHIGTPNFACVGGIAAGGYAVNNGGPIQFYKPNATTGHKRWQIQPDANNLNFQLASDDGRSSTTFMSVIRSANGAAAQSIVMPQTALGLGTATVEGGSVLLNVNGNTLFQQNATRSPKLYIAPIDTIGTRFILGRAGNATNNEALRIANVLSVDFAIFHGSTKRVGIGAGNTAPTGTLDIFDATPASGVTRLVAREGEAQAVREVLGVYANDGATPRLVVRAGNVGIGTATPSAKLHVAGDVLVEGNISAKSQDVAEWVETSERLEAGTVVIVDPSQPNRVRPASLSYDTRVAGAVSREPGLLLGDKGDTKSMVAQGGRVRVKADASYGAIRIGDLLVTSRTPGYAMRSRPVRVDGRAFHRSGTLLGKALEALPNGKGEILVLLTLH